MSRIHFLVLTAALALGSGRASAQERVVVRSEPGTPVVAAEVLVAVGPADEPEGAAGIAYLTARSVTAPILPVLDSLGAHFAIQQEKDAVSFTVIAAPDAWREATRALLVALFRDPVDSVATVRQRAAIMAELAAREASPADALDRETDAALFGAEHPWGRPAVGAAATVGKVGVAAVDNFLRRHFTADRAVVAVVGPVGARGATEHVALFLQPGEAAHREPVLSAVRGDTVVRRPYDAITAWVGAAFPFTAEADEEALRMLASLMLERVSFGPRRPSVYNSHAEVIRHAGGGEIRVQLVVPPHEAEDWASRIRTALADFRAQRLAEPVFAERLRRYRGERLRALDSPEARAHALARSAFLGESPDRVGGVDELTAERLHRAARALGKPALVFLSPAVDGSEQSTGAARAEGSTRREER